MSYTVNGNVWRYVNMMRASFERREKYTYKHIYYSIYIILRMVIKTISWDHIRRAYIFLIL